MLFSKRGVDGLWRLVYYSHGKTKKDDDGKEFTYATKQEAEKARRAFEKGSSGYASNKSDYYANRYPKRG